MVKKVVTIDPEKTVGEAARLMFLHNIGSVAVLEEGKLIGIITERDMVDRVLAKKLDPYKTKVRKVMSTPVITCNPKTTIGEALQIMENYRIRHLPVVDRKGKLVGIISSRDL